MTGDGTEILSNMIKRSYAEQAYADFLDKEASRALEYAKEYMPAETAVLSSIKLPSTTAGGHTNTHRYSDLDLPAKTLTTVERAAHNAKLEAKLEANAELLGSLPLKPSYRKARDRAARHLRREERRERRTNRGHNKELIRTKLRE